MKDALLLVDVVNTFDHEDGEKLLASFRMRLDAMKSLLERARAEQVPVLYVNDAGESWDSDAPRLVREALEGRGGEAVAAIAPEAGDQFVLKPRYSAFDHTPLVILLRDLGAERLVMAGAATERCVVQSAIDARELGFKVTLVPDALASVDDRMEALALEYAERIVGVRLERGDEIQLRRTPCARGRG